MIPKEICSLCGRDIRIGTGFDDAYIPGEKEGTLRHLYCAMQKLREMRKDGSVYW